MNYLDVSVLTCDLIIDDVNAKKRIVLIFVV